MSAMYCTALTLGVQCFVGRKWYRPFVPPSTFASSFLHSCAVPALNLVLKQAVSSKPRHNTLHKGSAGKKAVLSLDRSALDKARQMSKLLDEAPPMQGGCPFMLLPDDMLQPPGWSNSRSCPFSSSRAPGAHARGSPDHIAEDTVLPLTSGAPPDAHAREHPVLIAEDAVLPLTADSFSSAAAQERPLPDAEDNKVCPFGARSAAVTPAPAAAVPGDLKSRSVSSSHSDEPPHDVEPTAQGKRPFHFEPGSPCPLPSPSLPQPTAATEAAQAECELSGVGAITDEALKEYEQAFAVDPDEAMLQAYGALLADKVAEACGEADDSSQYGGQGHDLAHVAPQPLTPTLCGTPGQPTLPGPSKLAVACPTIQRHESASNANTAPQTSAQTPHHESTDPSSAAPATPLGNTIAGSSGSHAASAHSNAAVTAALSCQGLYDAYQHSMNRIGAWCGYLQQQPLRWHVLMTTCLGLQLVMMLYFSLVHQRYGTYLLPGSIPMNPAAGCLRIFLTT